VIKFSEDINNLLKDDGWAWLAPWNGNYSSFSKSLQQEMIEAQIVGFEQLGFKKIDLTFLKSRTYGVNGITFNRPIFYKNLKFMPNKFRMPFSKSPWDNYV
jgi:hypothetical protein